MAKRKDLKKILIIGSGPIVIGQAAEFDYAGAQACRVLKQAGVNVVLVNSNPATIMTDKALADEIYLEPLTTETVKRIIKLEKPDSLLAGLGGQVGRIVQNGVHGLVEQNAVNGCQHRVVGGDHNIHKRSASGEHIASDRCDAVGDFYRFEVRIVPESVVGDGSNGLVLIGFWNDDINVLAGADIRDDVGIAVKDVLQPFTGIYCIID